MILCEVLPVLSKDEDNIVLLGAVAQQLEHGDAGVARPVGRVQHVAQERVETLGQDPGALQKKCFIKESKIIFLNTSFLTIQSSISLSLSCSSGLQRVTTVLTRSSKSLTCWAGECHRWGKIEGNGSCAKYFYHSWYFGL